MSQTAPCHLPDQPCLQVRGLSTFFFTRGGIVKAVRELDLDLWPGSTLALVGESGCGKSITALSLLRLVPAPGRIVSGSIRLDGEELLQLPAQEMRRRRGNRIAMIFQDPMTALNPVLTIGRQLTEGLELHRGLSGRAALLRAAELLDQVGLANPVQRLRDYPHQLSGGMRQRVVIAMALAGKPQILIADEPTTALDVTIQAQIMTLLGDLQRQQNMALLLISHDLGLVAQNADEVAVMYDGLVVEQAPVTHLFDTPLHPYSRHLLNCIPRRAGQPTETASPTGPFWHHCPARFRPRPTGPPPLQQTSAGHWLRCWPETP
ncbi:MAG: ABC transporter ATP-binding protein [Desulfuromonas thiophila]|nr:ABC transporter ATP-binding protein [Desulfuromonas thiophila]